MAYQRPVFPILETTAGAGQSWTALQQGDALGSAFGGIVFGFRDSSGNVTMPQLDANGKLPITQDAAGTCKSAHGKVTPGALNNDDVVCSILTLTVSKDHVLQFMSGSAFRDTEFSVVQIDDATETVLHRVLAGAGDYNEAQEPVCVEFTTGATGTQQIELRANQIQGGLSDVCGTVAVLEKA